MEGIPARHSVPKRMILVAHSFTGIFGKIDGRSQPQGGGEEKGDPDKIDGADDGGQDSSRAAHIDRIGGKKGPGKLGESFDKDENDDKKQDADGQTGQDPEQGLD